VLELSCAQFGIFSCFLCFFGIFNFFCMIDNLGFDGDVRYLFLS
jgi:hypothetical protein